MKRNIKIFFFATFTALVRVCRTGQRHNNVGEECVEKNVRDLDTADEIVKEEF